jgi:nucleotide-binding universal stress UspA family protein
MKILLAIDGSACSNAAVAEICRRPWPPQSDVRVVTVTAPIDPPLIRGGAPTVFDEIVKQQRVESAKHLRDAAAVLAERASGLHVTTALLDDWPKDAIVTEAERWGADLVVVGSHGYGPAMKRTAALLC